MALEKVTSPSTAVVAAPAAPYRNIYGHGASVYRIFPQGDLHRSSQGFGIVFADNEFYALREAHSKGILPVTENYNLDTYYVAVRIGKGKTREELRQRSVRRSTEETA